MSAFHILPAHWWPVTTTCMGAALPVKSVTSEIKLTVSYINLLIDVNINSHSFKINEQ
jgi:hypothetical protein